MNIEVENIAYQSAINLFHRIHMLKGAILLDSARPSEVFGRYSYIALAPKLSMVCQDGQLQVGGKLLNCCPFDAISSHLEQYQMASIEGLPPFQGGLAGYFGYGMGRYLEDVPNHSTDDMSFPDMWLGAYDLVITFDHFQKKAYIIALEAVQANQAKAKIEWIKSLLTAPYKHQRSKTVLTPGDIECNMTKAQYLKTVEKTIDYIKSGDIFEANITQRFKAKLPDSLSAYELYQRVRHKNPAPFGAFLNLGDVQIASHSPERFLKLTQGQIETRPIKGTRPRGKDKVQDIALAKELLASEKDWAENVMIVDLMRNDLSRVCEPHSVKVPQLCGLESYPSVHHLVSVVNGKMKDKLGPVDLLKATFPGGSITGAPKIRAMEIIAELEPTERGPYCGSIGFISYSGDMDTSIVIRSYAAKKNQLTFQAGGAIVSDSQPLEEYEESLTKAHSLRQALLLVED